HRITSIEFFLFHLVLTTTRFLTLSPPLICFRYLVHRRFVLVMYIYHCTTCNIPYVRLHCLPSLWLNDTILDASDLTPSGGSRIDFQARLLGDVSVGVGCPATRTCYCLVLSFSATRSTPVMSL
ncbi:hypothetical protein EV363DRAFT_1353530, partial [Boletus edulis]